MGSESAYVLVDQGGFSVRNIRSWWVAPCPGIRVARFFGGTRYPALPNGVLYHSLRRAVRRGAPSNSTPQLRLATIGSSFFFFCRLGPSAPRFSPLFIKAVKLPFVTIYMGVVSPSACFGV